MSGGTTRRTLRSIGPSTHSSPTHPTHLRSVAERVAAKADLLRSTAKTKASFAEMKAKLELLRAESEEVAGAARQKVADMRVIEAVVAAKASNYPGAVAASEATDAAADAAVAEAKDKGQSLDVEMAIVEHVYALELLGLQVEASLSTAALEEAFEVKCREADGDADELYRLAAARAYLASYIQAAT